MIGEKKVNNEIQQLNILKTVTEAYSQIASHKLKKVRKFVLKNREFIADIDEIFRQVLRSYSQEVRRLAKKQKRGENVTFLAHNGKTVALFLSANTGLYGDIIGKTFKAFLRSLETPGVEAAIIGRLGRTLFEQARPNVPFSYFEYPDSEVDQEKLAQIIKHLVAYEKIHVYYGKFKNAAIQIPEMFEISAVVPKDDSQDKSKIQKFIFEPSLEKMLIFFETEIFASLLDQTLRESQLAKVASRITAMSKASENINQNLKKMQFVKLRTRHNKANRKQLNALAGIMHLRHK